MERKEMLKQLEQMKSKLMGAVAMLLVAAILLSSTSYAWFVLSTAPEVADMRATAGANGALEVALQSTTEDGDRAEIKSGVGDSSALASQSAQAANVTWGNIVDLTAGYGLENISLTPSRLHVNTEQSNHVFINSPLTIPKFGTDGRVVNLEEVGKLQYSEGSFVTPSGASYGVNVLGYPANVSEDGHTITRTMSRQSVLNRSLTQVQSYRAKMLEETQRLITANSAPIVDLLAYGIDGIDDTGLDEMLEGITTGFTRVLGEAEVSLEYALMACAAADTVTYPDNEAGQQAFSELYAEYLGMPLTTSEEGKNSVISVVTANKAALLAQGRSADDPIVRSYTSILTAAQNVLDAQQSVANAKNGSSGGAMLSMFSPNKVYVDGTKADPDVVMEGEQVISMSFGKTGTLQYSIWAQVGYLYCEEDIAAMKQDPVFCPEPPDRTSIFMVDGSGLFSQMAAVIGDYEAEARKQEGSGEDELNYIVPVYATSTDSYTTYSVSENTGCLDTVFQTAKNMRAVGSVTLLRQATPRVSAYGYSVDLAFRSSSGGNLLLQQEATDRVSGESTGSAQGLGSTVTFTAAEEMTGDQVERLLSSVYVVFMSTNDGAVYGVATADNPTVENGTVTATLTMHEARFSDDGLLTPGAARANQAITALPTNQNDALYVTALVYLNGDTVTSGDFANETTASLYGSINLQFASSEPLTAMQYTDYYAASNSVENNG